MLLSDPRIGKCVICFPDQRKLVIACEWTLKLFMTELDRRDYVILFLYMKLCPDLQESNKENTHEER